VNIEGYGSNSPGVGAGAKLFNSRALGKQRSPKLVQSQAWDDLDHPGKHRPRIRKGEDQAIKRERGRCRRRARPNPRVVRTSTCTCICPITASVVAQFEPSIVGVIPSGAAFQAERGISLKIVPREIPPAAELRRGSG
jgi:hypothetical protein